jgi:hypothetical protein
MLVPFNLYKLGDSPRVAAGIFKQSCKVKFESIN